MYFWKGIKQRWQKVGCVAFSQNDNKRLILGSLNYDGNENFKIIAIDLGPVNTYSFLFEKRRNRLFTIYMRKPVGSRFR